MLCNRPLLECLLVVCICISCSYVVLVVDDDFGGFWTEEGYYCSVIFLFVFVFISIVVFVLIAIVVNDDDDDEWFCLERV